MSPLTLTALLVTGAFELEWDAPASCSDRPDTATLVGASSGRAEVFIRERESKWVVTVMFFEPTEGFRRVTSPSCEEAVRAAGLLVQLGSRGASPTQQPVPVTDPEPVSPAVVVEPLRPPVDEAWGFWAGVGAALDVGTQPRPEPRFAASFLARRGLLGLAADLRMGVAQPVGSARVLRLLEGQGAVCLMPSLGPLRVGGCGSASVGSFRLSTLPGQAKGLGLATVGIQGRVGLPVSEHVELALLAGVRLNLIRPLLLDGERSFLTGLGAVDVQLSLGWRW